MRDLTLYGKIQIIKTLAFPKIIFICSVLLSPVNFEKEINSLTFSFIWNNKPAKIKKLTLIADKIHGGLKMIDFTQFSKAVKAMWAKQLNSETKCEWQIIPHYYLENVGSELIFECNYDCKLLDTSHYPPFYKTVLSAWQEVNAAIQKENQSIHNDFIWNNKHIVVNNKSLYIKSWHEAGVTKIKDLVKDKSFLTYNKFLNICKVKTHFLQYHALVGAIPNKWEKTVKRQSNNDEASDFNPSHKPLQKLSTKTAYNILISTQIEPATAQSKILNSDKVTKENIPLYYSMPFVVTTETKLSTFQYKIIHDILPTTHFYLKRK